MNLVKKIFSPKPLWFLMIGSIVAGLVSLTTGIIFLFIYFWNHSSCCCDAISWIDTSFVLISLGLGFLTLSFSLNQIRNHETEKSSSESCELVKIYELYKQTANSENYLKIYAVLRTASAHLQKQFNRLFNYHLEADDEDGAITFENAWREIKEKYFDNNLENYTFEGIKEFDSENLTLKSKPFQKAFKKLVLELEEISFRMSKLTIVFEDIIYEQYIMPFVLRTFIVFLPYIQYYCLDGDTQYLSTFVQNTGEFVEEETSDGE